MPRKTASSEVDSPEAPAAEVRIDAALAGESREAFRAALALDAATWARGRGWALWKALVTLAEFRESDPAAAAKARRMIEAVLADHASRAAP